MRCTVEFRYLEQHRRQQIPVLIGRVVPEAMPGKKLRSLEELEKAGILESLPTHLFCGFCLGACSAALANCETPKP